MKELTNEQLLDLADEARASLSYYNAAEGDSYRRETDARYEASNRWGEVREELAARGLEARAGSYLI